MNSRTVLMHPIWRAFAVCVVWVLHGTMPAFAQTSSTDVSDYRAIAWRWATDAATANLPATETPLRLEVTVGSLDSRLKLAPCGNVEAYLPAGARLWGRTRVALRCVDGLVRWNVTMPATVKALGTAWVVKNQIAAGSILSESDVVEATVDWADESAPVLEKHVQWQGQAASRVLSTGQTLRQGMVRPAQVFQAGAPVRVVAQGPGFQVSSDGQALSAGVVGQLARVRMENGRIASGVVLDMRTVRIDL